MSVSTCTRQKATHQHNGELCEKSDWVVEEGSSTGDWNGSWKIPRFANDHYPSEITLVTPVTSHKCTSYRRMPRHEMRLDDWLCAKRGVSRRVDGSVK